LTMLIGLSRLFARLPLRGLHALGALLGWAALLTSSGFRRKARANLATAGLLSRRTLWQSAGHAGRAVLETPLVWWGDAARLERLILTQGQALLEEARRTGRGVMLLTPHLGSFEVAARASARSGPITVLYKPPRLAWARRWVEAGRGTPGIRPVPASAAGVRGLVRALRKGEAIGVLPDQVPSAGDGVWAGFFGRPAYTMTLPARLAALTGAVVFMVHGERLAHGRGWCVRFERLDEVPTPANINRAMEHLIRQLPEQYFWGYNRYKVPPRPPGPDTAEPATPPAAASREGV
jgi:KDO2-lipid IV(A) lauroyltransferase